MEADADRDDLCIAFGDDNVCIRATNADRNNDGNYGSNPYG